MSETNQQVPTLDEIRLEIMSISPEEHGAGLDEACVVFALCTFMRGDAAAVCEWGRFDDCAFVYRTAKHLRKNGVVHDDGSSNVDCWDGDGGGIAFWLDVNVAKGYAQRAIGDDGQITWRMTKEGTRRAEKIIRGR